jgi:outer membrane protein
MEAKFSKRKDELESKRERFQSDVERLKRDGSVMSQSAREKLESQLRDDQRQLKLLQEEYAEDVQLAEQKEMESIRNDIFEVIERVAKREKYDLMLAEGIIYAADSVDITEKVAAELKR